MSISADIAMLDGLAQAAFSLAVDLSEMAKSETDFDRKLTLVEAYCKSSAGVRLSIALKMRLEREARAPARPEREPEIETERLEQPEPADRPEHYDERDRERDRETVSLPILLRTLERVADDAETLLPQPAELPTLRELLARLKASQATASPLHTMAVIPVSPPGEDRDPTVRRSVSSGIPPRPGPSSPARSTSRLGPGLGLPPKPG